MAQNANINNISVAISLATTPISQAGFSKPLIVGTTLPVGSVDLIGAIDNVAGYEAGATTIVVDGLIDALNPVSEGDRFTIVGETGSPIHTVVSTTVDEDGYTIGITFTTAIASTIANDTVINIIKKVSDLYYEISDADDLLDASIGYTANDEEYKMAQAIFSQSPRISTVAVVSISSWANLPTEIAELRNYGKDDWYFALLTTKDKANIAIADTYFNSLKKLLFVSTSDQTITSTGLRTVVLISNHANEHPDAAWVGRCGAEAVGSISWDSKQLNSQKGSEITQSQQSSMLALNFNVIGNQGGVLTTWQGKTAGGQYIDVIMSQDWLLARLTEGWHALKVNTKKIPFTNQGRSMVESYIREVFRTAGRQGIVAPVISEADGAKSDLGDFQYKLEIPEIEDIAANDKANQVFAPIRFVAVISGSISTISISGVLTV
jgi:hypothetical protein